MGWFTLGMNHRLSLVGRTNPIIRSIDCRLLGYSLVLVIRSRDYRCKCKQNPSSICSVDRCLGVSCFHQAVLAALKVNKKVLMLLECSPILCWYLGRGANFFPHFYGESFPASWSRVSTYACRGGMFAPACSRLRTE